MRPTFLLSLSLLVGCYDLTPLPPVDAGVDDASGDAEDGAVVEDADAAEGGR